MPTFPCTNPYSDHIVDGSPLKPGHRAVPAIHTENRTPATEVPQASNKARQHQREVLRANFQQHRKRFSEQVRKLTEIPVTTSVHPPSLQQELRSQIKTRVKNIRAVERDLDRKRHEEWVQHEVEEFVRYQGKGFGLDADEFGIHS